MLKYLLCVSMAFLLFGCPSRNAQETSSFNFQTSGYDIAYYREYFYEGQRYLLREEERIPESEALEWGSYIKAYLDSEDLVARADRYEHHILQDITLYTYHKGERTESFNYNNSRSPLNMEGKYTQGRLISRKKYDESGKLIYTSRVRHIPQKGIQESFYSDEKTLTYVIYYNQHKRPLRLIYYHDGQESERIDFSYNQEKLLKRKVYYARGRVKSYQIFRYSEERRLLSIQSYRDKQLISNTRFNTEGEEERIDYYKNKRLTRYVKILHEQALKRILWYNQFDQISRKQTFNRSGQVLEDLHYNSTGLLHYAQYYSYDSQKLQKAEIYRQDRLHMRTTYNPDALPIRIERYNARGALELIIEKRYNKQRQLHTELYKDPHRLILQKLFHYDKRGRIIIEDISTQNGHDHKKVYEYRNRGRQVLSIKYFRKQQLFKKEFLNETGQVIKREYGDAGQKIKTELYKYKGQKLRGIRVLDPYDNIEQSIRIRYSKDSSTGYKVMQEDAYDRRDQYLGSVVSYYDSQENLFKKEIFNYLQDKIETLLFDPDTGLKTSHQKHQQE